VRPTVALISLLTGALSACATSAPPRLGYAPPSAEPGELGSAYAGQPADLIWNQLLDRLIQSPLEVDLADPERGIIVATYSGDPEPYVTCGWILVHRGGEFEEVPASGEASFKRVVQGRRLEVSRGMKLNARLVVQVKPDGRGAGVATTSNYVLTKTTVAEDSLGWSRGRAHEVVSFSAGERGEFSKGTVCQPNGALERIVLDVLPRMARVQPAESSTPPPAVQTADSGRPAPSMQITENSEPAPTAQTPDSGKPAPSAQIAESTEPGPARQAAETSGPAPPTTQTTESDEPAPAGQATIAQSEVPDAEIAELPDAEGAEVPEAELAALPDAEGADVPDSALAELLNPEEPEVSALEDGAASLECPIADKIFCELLDVTDPYRRANQERNLGLTVDAIEGSNPLLSGSDLGFDVTLPSYDAYLTVSFFLKDGTVHHVLSGSDRRWPANAREFVGDAGLNIDDRGSVEMVVALASDVPVFPLPRPPSEAAELYLSDLRERLVEISNGGSPAQIAASLLIVTPA
jgi:hypothetical protein